MSDIQLKGNMTVVKLWAQILHEELGNDLQVT
jgi:hypothetical protein